MSVGSFFIKFVSAALLPPLNLVLLCIVGLGLRRKWPRAGLGISSAALILLVVLATNAGARLLIAPIEDDVSALAAPDVAGAEAIVVLGGGRIDSAPEYEGRDIPQFVALARLRYAARLQRRTQLPILVSGGAASGEREPEAELMARALRDDFGVSVKWVEGSSLDTAENAAFSASLLHAAGISHILLVTDALHMMRSRRIFMAAGLQVVPAPTAFLTRGPLKPIDFLPTGEGMRRSHYALHEWIGMMWYRLRHGASSS